MYALSDIRAVHLEMTEKCQSGCPLCPRYRLDGSVNPYVTNAEVTLEKCRQYFTPQFIKQLFKLFMCGNYGDPIIAKDTLEAFDYFRTHNSTMRLDMHTNGGARSSRWWKDLAGVLSTEHSFVIFSLDGLKDTNHLYRKGVNWDIALNSARSFIEAGGNAVWSFIVFKHNEHQIEEAKALSEKLGFKKFLLKKSYRLGEPDTKHLYPLPDNQMYHNQGLTAIDKIRQLSGQEEVNNFYRTVDIDCDAMNTSGVYVSAKGKLFPCCWFDVDVNPQDRERLSLLYANDNNNLNKLSMEDIFNSRLFDRIEDSWYNDKRIGICPRNCSKKFNFLKAQQQCIY